MEKTFITHDGVKVSSRELVWYCYKNIGKTEIPISHRHTFEFVPDKDDAFYYFSSKESCQEYIDKMNSPIIFTTKDGVDMRVGDKYYCADKHYFLLRNEVFGPYECDSNCVVCQDGPYFSSEAKAQKYLDSLNEPKVVEPIVPVNLNLLNNVNVNIGTVDLPKSELEIAYDKLQTLCAKYRPEDVTTIFIDVVETYPSKVKTYTIRTETDDSYYKSARLESLDDLIVLFHARLIEQS